MNLANIYSYRIENNISQKEIIEFLKISKGTYSAWENGQDIIPLKRLIDICDYLNISVDFALNISNTKSYKNYNSSFDKNTLQERLKSIRKEKNLTLKELALKLNTSPSVLSRYENGKSMTQKELAEILNITDKAISKWERGLSFPDIVMLKPLSEIFNISIDYLLGKSNGPKFLK